MVVANNIDKEFIRAWPYGMLKTVHWDCNWKNYSILFSPENSSSTEPLCVAVHASANQNFFQILAPLAVLITIWLGPYTYHSVGFVLFAAWNAFIVCLITWICYIIGLNQKNIQIGGGFMFIPFALIDFVVACAGIIAFGLSSLICIISMIDAINYRASVVFTYLFSTIFCVISGAAFGYFSILVYRAIPNGQFRYLMTMVIEGDRTTMKEGGPAGAGLGSPPPPV